MHVSMSQNFRAAVKKEEKCRVASTAMVTMGEISGHKPWKGPL